MANIEVNHHCKVLTSSHPPLEVLYRGFTLDFSHHLVDISQASFSLWVLGRTPTITRFLFHLNFFHYR